MGGMIMTNLSAIERWAFSIDAWQQTSAQKLGESKRFSN